MPRLITTSALAAVLAATLTTGAFAKAHDQGVADGTPGSGVFGPGDAAGLVDDLVNKGKQGEAKQDPANRGGVTPVVGQGANAPDAE